MKSRKVIGSIAAAASLMLLAGCAQGSAPEEGGDEAYEVAWFSYGLSNTYLTANLEGIDSVASENNVNITSFDANADSATQVRQLKDAMATGQYDAFIIYPVDAAAVIPVAQDALDLGITVSAVSFPISEDPTSYESGVDGVITVAYSPADNGVAVAEGMIAACEGIDPCAAAYLVGSPALPSDAARVEAVKATLAEHPNIDLVATPEGGWDQTAGLKATQDLLASTPKLDVIGASAGQAIGGALKALEGTDLAGTVKLVSNGGTTQDITAIRDGSMFASAVLFPFDEGKLVMEYVLEALEGGDPPMNTNIIEQSPFGTIATLDILNSPEGQDFVGQYSA